MKSNLDTQFDSQFEKKPVAAVMDKLYGMRDDVSDAFLPQYDKYCQEVEDILASNPTAATKKYVLKLLEAERKHVVKTGNSLGTKAKLKIARELHEAANDDNYRSVA